MHRGAAAIELKVQGAGWGESSSMCGYINLEDLQQVSNCILLSLCL